MKIKLNNEYVTRSGLPVRIYAIDCLRTPEDSVHGAVLYAKDCWRIKSWCEDGSYYMNAVNELDLILPTKFSFDWSCLPKWANKYITKGKGCNIWKAWAEQPELAQYGFGQGDFKSKDDYEGLSIPKKYCPEGVFEMCNTYIFKNPEYID